MKNPMVPEVQGYVDRCSGMIGSSEILENPARVAADILQHVTGFDQKDLCDQVSYCANEIGE